MTTTTRIENASRRRFLQGAAGLTLWPWHVAHATAQPIISPACPLAAGTRCCAESCAGP